MTNTLTCPCGKTLLVEAKQPDAPAICPACGKAVVDPATALQAHEPTVRSATGITSEVKSRPSATELDGLDPDIRRRRDRSPALVASIFVVGTIIVIILVGFLLTRPIGMGADKTDIALFQAKTISKACETYASRFGRLPDKLEDLLVQKDGRGPFLESPDALIDPWNARYQYDPKGPRNDGKLPDIWTVNPRTGELYGNWPITR